MSKESFSRRDFIRIFGVGLGSLLLPSCTGGNPRIGKIESTDSGTNTLTQFVSETPSSIKTTTPSDTPTLTETPTPTQNLTPTSTENPYSTSLRFHSEVIGSVETEKNEYAITIDDGWSAEAFKGMLALLKNSNTRATFFLIGQAAQYALGADLLKQALNEGYEFGYHSLHHPAHAYTKEMTINDWKEDYRNWRGVMKWLLGEELFRSGVKPIGRVPYGDFTPEYLAMSHEYGLVPVSWNREPGRDSSNSLKKGDIVLLHANVFPDGVDALKVVLGESSLKGVSFSELISK